MGPVQLRAVQDLEALTRHYNEFADSMNDLLGGGVFTQDQRVRIAVVLTRLNLIAEQMRLVRMSLKEMGFFEQLSSDDVLRYLTEIQSPPKN